MPVYVVMWLWKVQNNPQLEFWGTPVCDRCYERTEVHCVSWTSLPVSERTEGNSLRIRRAIALANELERSRESSWDLSGHNTRVVAK